MFKMTVFDCFGDILEVFYTRLQTLGLFWKESETHMATNRLDLELTYTLSDR